MNIIWSSCSLTSLSQYRIIVDINYWNTSGLKKSETEKDGESARDKKKQQQKGKNIAIYSI